MFDRVIILRRRVNRLTCLHVLQFGTRQFSITCAVLLQDLLYRNDVSLAQDLAVANKSKALSQGNSVVLYFLSGWTGELIDEKFSFEELVVSCNDVLDCRTVFRLLKSKSTYQDGLIRNTSSNTFQFSQSSMSGGHSFKHGPTLQLVLQGKHLNRLSYCNHV